MVGVLPAPRFCVAFHALAFCAVTATFSSPLLLDFLKVFFVSELVCEKSQGGIRPGGDSRTGVACVGWGDGVGKQSVPPNPFSPSKSRLLFQMMPEALNIE
jgi:hypothetical protein